MKFKEGHNCWQVANAQRVTFLVDGECYFNAVADAFESASQSIYILGWDIDSRIRLRRDSQTNDEETFGEFVDRLARQKPGLEIYILEWDFAMLYTLERETWPLLSLGWRTHERVHFALDDVHPVGASHHQKIVVVDDKIAFVGGFDLASCRWDTPEHAPDNQNRVDNEESYGPFHDVQMLVDGEVAKELSSLVRYRWEKATGDVLPSVDENDKDPWPEHLDADVEDVPVAILRTIPRFEGEPEVREVEQFYLDAINYARSYIYIENQYLTSHRIGSALVKSLEQDTGPEILLVLPRQCSGWLEQETMGALRQRLIRRLYNADQHQRLKICYPDHQEFDDQVINVHSKVLIVDDQLVTVGSANLSNRSMGFDTECNLAFTADNHATAGEAIERFRNRLLGEHLGTEVNDVAEHFAETGSLLKTIESLNQGTRVLNDLRDSDEQTLTETLSADEVVDPEQPIDIDKLLSHLGFGHSDADEKVQFKRKAWRFAIVLIAAMLLAVLWRWSPLNQWLNIDTLLQAVDFIRESPMTTPVVLTIYVVGSCLMFPITLMILATALSFGPFTGFALAFSGSLLGGLASYLLGRWLGRDVVQKLAGNKLNRLSRKIAKRGWLAIALVRVVPIAPYTIINMVAGATHISARSFLIGTGIGMGPGIMAIMIFSGGLEQVLRQPSWSSLALGLTALLAGGLVLLFGRRWLTRKEEAIDD